MTIPILMRITDFNERQELFNRVQRIASRLLQRGKSEASKAISDALKQYEEGRFQLLVMGKANRGKSTLVNALLGRSDDQLAPIDRLPATSTISRYFWDPAEAAIVTYRDSRQETIPYSRVREFVIEDASCNPANVKQVESVDVKGPFAGFDRDLVLVDTPGAGSIHEHHDIILDGIIPKADAVIFLVTARMPIDQDEQNLLRKIKQADISRFFFVINRLDELKNPADLENAVAHNKAILKEVGIPCETVYPISAKLAFEGDIAHSGLPALAEAIRLQLRKEKGILIKDRLLDGLREAIEPVLASLELEVQLASSTGAEVEAEKKRLESAKKTIEKSKDRVEHDFTQSWGSAIDTFERAIKPLLDQIQDEAEERIRNTPVISLSQFKQDLPNFLTRTIEKKLAKPAESLEEALRAACQKLEAEFPRIDIGEAGRIEIKVSEDRKILIKTTAITGAALLLPVLPGAIAGTIPYVGWLLGLGTTLMFTPPGFALAGLAALTIPFSYRATKLKLREDMQEASRKQIKAVFDMLRYERIPDLRRSSTALIEEHRRRLKQQIFDLETSIEAATDRQPDPKHKAALQEDLDKLHADYTHIQKLLPAPSH